MAHAGLAKLFIFLTFLVLFVMWTLMTTTEPLYDNEAEELLDGRDWSEVRQKVNRLNLTSTVIEQYAEEKTMHLFEGVKSIWSKMYSFK